MRWLGKGKEHGMRWFGGGEGGWDEVVWERKEDGMRWFGGGRRTG